MAGNEGDSILKGIRRAIMKRVRDQTRRLIRPILQKEPNLAAKYLAYREDYFDFIIEKTKRQPDAPLAVPPRNMWVAVGPGGYGETEKEYLGTGRQHVQNLGDLLEQVGFSLRPQDRVLELGCATGRLLRWFEEQARTGEVWGVDVNAEHIVWCQQNLSPPFHFCTTTTLPHLPFEDRWFELIYAGSVFTHIDELADAWFLELRRLLKPGGCLYVTVNDDHSKEAALRHPEYNLSRRINEAKSRIPIEKVDYAMFSISRSYTIYDRDYLEKKLSRWFEVAAVKPEMYGLQTGMVLRKR